MDQYDTSPVYYIILKLNMARYVIIVCGINKTINKNYIIGQYILTKDENPSPGIHTVVTDQNDTKRRNLMLRFIIDMIRITPAGNYGSGRRAGKALYICLIFRNTWMVIRKKCPK